MLEARGTARSRVALVVKKKCRTAVIPIVVFAVVPNLGAFDGDRGGRDQTEPDYSFTPVSLTTNPLWLVPARTAQFGLGFDIHAQWQAPISGLQGTLYRLAIVRAEVGIASNVVLQIRGPVRQILAIDETSSQPLPGMPASGTTSDAGDFSVATIMRLYENRSKTAALGFHVETRLPNSTQRKGIGTNTTDIFMSVLASGKWRNGMIFGDLGMGILTAPLEVNVQNDVLLYGLGTILIVREQLRLFGEINGYLTTRNIIPVGTEARGMARAGLAWQCSSWGVETSVQHGLTRNEGKWGGSVGVTRKISW
ncbi:MAG: hypothetical protein ACREOO_03665 [bacterium]